MLLAPQEHVASTANIINSIQEWALSWLLTDDGGKKAPLPKICHTYLTMMKLATVIPYLKEIQKVYESRDKPPEFC